MRWGGGGGGHRPKGKGEGSPASRLFSTGVGTCVCVHARLF